jgi:hypothetical protein
VYSPGKVGWVATQRKDASSVEGELTDALTRFGEGMAVQRLTVLQGGPADAARFRGAPGQQHLGGGGANKPNAAAHRKV